MLKVGSKVKVVFTGSRPFCPEGIYTVQFNSTGQLGIDYNRQRSPYTAHGEIVVPFWAFADTVHFINVNTGKEYHYSNLKNKVEVIQ